MLLLLLLLAVVLLNVPEGSADVSDNDVVTDRFLLDVAHAIGMQTFPPIPVSPPAAAALIFVSFARPPL